MTDEMRKLDQVSRFRRVLKFQVIQPLGAEVKPEMERGGAAESISQGRRLARTRQGPGQGKKYSLETV